jgi:hypothetical protein
VLLVGPETMVPLEFWKVQFVVCSSRVVLMLLMLCRYSVALFDVPGCTVGHGSSVVSFLRFGSQ